jgi:flagellar protein FliL
MTDTGPERADQPTRRGKASMLVWIILAAVSIGGGFATPFLMDKFSSHPVPEEKEEEPKREALALVEFGEVVVNLNESRLNRYLRLTISMMVDGANSSRVTSSVDENRPVLKSWLLAYLADKNMEDIRGAAGQNRLRREIQVQFNSIMFPGEEPLIKNVLFQDFNVQ